MPTRTILRSKKNQLTAIKRLHKESLQKFYEIYSFIFDAFIFDTKMIKQTRMYVNAYCSLIILLNYSFQRPFAVGITLAQVERENEGGKIDKHSPIISKVVRLTDLAVYWDTNNYPLKFDTLPDMCAQMKDLVRIIYINTIHTLLIPSQIYTEENKVKHGFMLSPMSGHIKVLSTLTKSI